MRHQGAEVFGVYRHPLISGALAAAIVAVTAFASAMEIGDGPPHALSASWPSTAIIASSGAWFAWRALRLSITVTSDGVEVHEFFVDRWAPWSAVDDIGVRRLRGRGLVHVRGNGMPTYWFNIPTRRIDPFVDDVVTARRFRQRPLAPATAPGVRRHAVLVACTLAVLALSSAVLRGADMDEQEHAERLARDRSAAATVLSWTTHEVGDGEDGSHTETWAMVRFAPSGSAPLEVQMKRRGVWPNPGPRLTIVYDPLHPNDIDFMDLPKRNEQRRSYETRRGWATAGLAVGALVLLGAAFASLTSRVRATTW